MSGHGLKRAHVQPKRAEGIEQLQADGCVLSQCLRFPGQRFRPSPQRQLSRRAAHEGLTAVPMMHQCAFYRWISIKTVQVAGKGMHVHTEALGAGSSRGGTVFSPLQFMRILRHADKKYSTVSFTFYGPLAE